MKALHTYQPLPFGPYKQLKVEYEEERALLWFKYNSQPRPCFTPTLLDDLNNCQRSVIDYVNSSGPGAVPIHYLVLASNIPGIHNLGGDLDLFRQLISNRDKQGLSRYAYACIEALYRNATNLGLPLTTIALVQGSALGGGFEAALSCNVVIAEKGVDFGFPEILFNLFPGMGAYSLLSRRISMRETEQMITNGRMYSSEELFDMGVVDVLAETGEGEEALYEYVRNHRRARNGLTAAQRARQRLNPLTYEELADITDIWVDAALNLEARDLRLIERLVRAQNRKVDDRAIPEGVHLRLVDTPTNAVVAG